MAPKREKSAPAESKPTTKPIATYSTRSSKRKADEINNSDSTSMFPPSNSQSSVEDPESSGPPPKKSRTSSTTSKDGSPPSHPIIQSSSAQEPASKIDSPFGSPEDDSTPAPDVAVPAFRGSSRGRGKGRARGRGGRGRGGGARRTPTIPAITPGVTRGKGGHRVKKSNNARIQALYHRRYALKQQFKQVAALQRNALNELSQKTLDQLEEDPEYYKTLPEYQEVTDGLQKKFDDAIRLIDNRKRIEEEFLSKQLEDRSNYSRIMCLCREDDLFDDFDTRIKGVILHILEQAETGKSIEETPFHRRADVQRIEREPSFVHPIGTPYRRGYMEVETGSTTYVPVIHPADWWKSLSAAEKKTYSSEQDKSRPSMVKKRGAAQKKVTNKNVSPSKEKTQDDTVVATKKTSLYQPAALPSIGEPSAMETPADGNSPEGGFPDDEDDGGLQSEGPEDLPDSYGTLLPRKPGNSKNGDIPQNRFITDPHFVFDDKSEIGIRTNHFKNKGRWDAIFLGTDPSANPKKFFYDQAARDHNTARNRPGDLDEALVDTFKVHPLYGLPVKGSVNPDFSELVKETFDPQTDWSVPLPVARPKVFIEEGQHTVGLLDQEKPTYHTSRSAWMVGNNTSFEEKSARDSVAAVTSAVMERESERDVTERERQEDEAFDEQARISDALLLAVNQVSTAPPVPQFISPAPRSYGYDPVRDLYAEPAVSVRAPAPARAPAPFIGPTSVHNPLDALADAASISQHRARHLGPSGPNSTGVEGRGSARGVPRGFRELRPAPSRRGRS